jgi:electron transfer flavoprotein alpha subunit
MAVIECPLSRPQMGTIRPGVFKKSPCSAINTSIIRETITELPIPRVSLVERLVDTRGSQAEPGINQALEEAAVVVSGGLGMGKPENFRYLNELAAEIGASVASSRGAVDAGWAPYTLQVGQSGKSISPNVYIACGISGAIQHLAGISSSELVIAINNDPHAPIFTAADYGIIGNALEIVPALTEEIRRIKAKKRLK